MKTSKLETLLERFQGNAYPAMLDDFAQHLGVSADSLRRLAPGFAPIVTFKKGKNFSGWWVIPERDADGDPIGLSLRSQRDMKVMYPGSKHGLIYQVNPNHSRGEKGYSSGAHNWVRTMDAGVPCPVCGKPDGCVLSSENPADPKAVICIREKTGAARPLKFGFLHIRKSEGNLKQTTALADNGGPVVLIEGMSDTATALDLGFDAVGRPSNLACMDLLCDLVRGRAVIVVGENDRKADGKEPGREGMVAAFQMAKRVCRDVKMVMPPEHVKDLRAWRVKYGLTRDQFLQFVEEQGQQHVDTTVIADERPTTIARAFLDSRYRMASRYTLRRWESTWYSYGGSKYVPLKDEVFIKPLYDWSYDKHVRRENKDGGFVLTPLICNSALVSNLGQAITAETLVPETRIPVWINGASGPNPQDVIVFANGILDVPAFLDGDSNALLDPTPDLFTTAALPFAFDPTAVCPTWLSFLSSSLGDEMEKVDLLQEWIGYCMTTDTSHQKLMYLRGPTGAGKGRVLEVLCDLVGEEQAAAASFSDLAGQFGLAPLVGKLVCAIGDARVPRNGDSMRGLELLLNIAGNDRVSINRKFKDQLEGNTLSCRITIASNEILDVPDHAGALMRRLNFIEFRRTFKDNPDYQLPAKLRRETAGIAVWALAGLRRLREQGSFTVPPSSQLAMSEWKTATSPVAAFLEECCDQGEGTEVQKAELYDCWTKWSAERRMYPMPTTRFYERIRSNARFAESATYEKGGHKFSVFRGISLKGWAARQYLGRPT